MAKSRAKNSVGGSSSPDIYELLREKRGDILETAAHYGFSNVRVFGSVARGEARPDSDLDLFAQPGPETSLFDHIGLEQDLEDMLGPRLRSSAKVRCTGTSAITCLRKPDRCEGRSPLSPAHCGAYRAD